MENYERPFPGDWTVENKDRIWQLIYKNKHKNKAKEQEEK